MHDYLFSVFNLKIDGEGERKRGRQRQRARERERIMDSQNCCCVSLQFQYSGKQACRALLQPRMQVNLFLKLNVILQKNDTDPSISSLCSRSCVCILFGFLFHSIYLFSRIWNTAENIFKTFEKKLSLNISFLELFLLIGFG